MPPVLERRSRRHRVGVVAAAFLLAMLAAPLPARSQADLNAEAMLKAKLTISLTRFAQWPAGAGAAGLRLCVAQRDMAVAHAFAEGDGQVVNGRRIQVIQAPPWSACHVLFVHASADRVGDLIRAASTAPVLIVGDADGTLAHGGMVEFVSVNDSIRFDVNMPAVRRAQLSLSSHVLKLARQVRE
jgi:hypothetical protein